jgi:hypothetical protein
MDRKRGRKFILGPKLQIEKFILDEAGIQQPEFSEVKLRIVNGNI